MLINNIREYYLLLYQLNNMVTHIHWFFKKTMNTEFSEIEVWLTDQNNNALEIEDNVNISLIINTS